MPRRIWSNASDDELKRLIESLQRRITTGEIAFMTQPGGGQVQTSMQGAPPAMRTLAELHYEAFRRGLAGYENPYSGMIKRTTPSYVEG